MNQPKIRLALALIALAASSSASALTVACVNCATSWQATAIQQAINQSRTSIVGAIQGASTAQTNATMSSAKSVSEANARTQANMERARIESKYKPLDPCSVTAVSAGGAAATRNRPGGSGRGAGGGGGSGSSPSTAGASTEMAKAIEISSGAQSAPAPEIVASLAAKGACSSFASGGVREKTCRDAGFSTGMSSGFPNADVRAETLFDGPQSASDMSQGVNRKLTIRPGNTPERTAVAAYIRNLETPVDLRQLTAKELDSDQGRNYMALRDSYEASMSLATKPLRDQESAITANRATLPIIQQLLKGDDATFVTAYLNQAYSRWQQDGISYAELLNLETQRRYFKARWHERMAAANEKQLLAEQVQLQAVGNWLMADVNEKLRQLLAVEGGVAGSVIRQEKLGALVTAHKAAQR